VEPGLKIVCGQAADGHLRVGWGAVGSAAVVLVSSLCLMCRLTASAQFRSLVLASR
jgi:hypothetical protein